MTETKNAKVLQRVRRENGKMRVITLLLLKVPYPKYGGGSNKSG